MSTTSTRTAPQLLFDDGSRAMQQDESAPSAAAGRDCSIPLRDYYEIDRLVQEINALAATSDAWQYRIALQFPDGLLADAPDVCWEFEQDLPAQALVFCLGDTTYQSCCPDVVAAQHLNADVIVHYGHACLLSQAVLPVLYSFGKQPVDIQAIVHTVVATKQHDDDKHSNLLLVYEVQYAHAMKDLQSALEPHFETVLLGQIPLTLGQAATTATSLAVSSCEQSTCACHITTTTTIPEPTETKPQSTPDAVIDSEISTDTLILGGLEIPPCTDWSKTTLLFMGQDQDSRPLQNMLLRFATDPKHAPAAYWTYNPQIGILNTDISASVSKLLNRRFYLTQKAKLANIFGILVANPSDAKTRAVVRHLQALLQAHGAAQYNFMVGKVNPHKLANFPEVDVFCLVACPEHAFLPDERSDYSVPIITPLELAMALSDMEWGSLPYSLDTRDFLKHTAGALARLELEGDKNLNEQHDEEDEDNDDDAPYFNPVTGRYETIARETDSDVNLQALPGKGQLTTYQSAAAAFLKQRTYQGLSVDAGQTAVQAAIPGQNGIASDYNNR